MQGEKENMFYITGVLITGFSPEKPEIRHEKCRLLSPRFLSLSSILFSFLLGMFFLELFFSLCRYCISCTCLAIVWFNFSQIFFFLISPRSSMPSNTSNIFLFATDKSTSPPPFLLPLAKWWCKKIKGRREFFLPYMQCLRLIVHEPPVPNLNLESFSWNAKNDICFSL